MFPADITVKKLSLNIRAALGFMALYQPMDNYAYKLDGLTQYGQLSSPINIPSGQSFELEIEIDTIPFAEVSNDTLFSSGSSGATIWIYIDSNDPKILRFKLNGNYRALTFSAPVNGLISARYEAIGELVYATSNGQTVFTGMPAHTGVSLVFIGTRGADAFLPATVRNIKAWLNGSKETGYLALDCHFNNKSIGANQTSIIGPDINIINYNVEGWK